PDRLFALLARLFYREASWTSVLYKNADLVAFPARYLDVALCNTRDCDIDPAINGDRFFRHSAWTDSCENLRCGHYLREDLAGQDGRFRLRRGRGFRRYLRGH